MTSKGNPGMGTCAACGSEYRCEAKTDMKLLRVVSVTDPCPKCGDHFLSRHRGDPETFTIRQRPS